MISQLSQLIIHLKTIRIMKAEFNLQMQQNSD